VKQKAMEYVQNTLAWWYWLLFPASVSISTNMHWVQFIGLGVFQRCYRIRGPVLLLFWWGGGKGTGYMQLIGSNSGQWCRWGHANTIYHSAIFPLHNSCRWQCRWALMSRLVINEGCFVIVIEIISAATVHTYSGSSPFCTGYFSVKRSCIK
jgi:hypothetical protein